MCLCPNKGCNKAIDLRASRSPTVRERGTSDHGAAGPTKGKCKAGTGRGGKQGKGGTGKGNVSNNKAGKRYFDGEDFNIYTGGWGGGTRRKGQEYW